MTQRNLSMKQNHKHREQTCDWWGVGGGGGKDWEFKVSRCKLIHMKWINNKVLLNSTGNYIQYSVINHSGKECAKECIYMCNQVTLLYDSN